MKRFNYIFQAVALAVVCIGLLGAGKSPDERFSDLGHRLMCKCGCNQILLECNHVGCPYSSKMRDMLSAGIKRGDNDETVLAAFVQEYGATVLAAPTTKGFNLVAWIMPFLALVAGIGLVAVIARKWKFCTAPVGVPDMSIEELDEFRKRAREETQV